MPFTKVAPDKYKSPSGRTFNSKQVKMYYATNGFTKKKTKPKIVINNKIKAFGQTDTKIGRIEINRKKHKGDRSQLADTIKHELYHVKHPKAHEKTVYKKTPAIGSMSKSEEDNLISKLRNKSLNYKVGIAKKKLKLKGDLKPGDLISKMNDNKVIKNNQLSQKEKISIMGMV